MILTSDDKIVHQLEAQPRPKATDFYADDLSVSTALLIGLGAVLIALALGYYLGRRIALRIGTRPPRKTTV